MGGFGGGGRGGGGGGGAAPGQRPSGRGSLTDPDVIQSMPQQGPRPQQPARPGEEGIPEEMRQFAAALIPPANMRPRVVLRFNTNEKELLISGMLAGGSELTGKAAVVDVPVGKGHVVMFANNPMWRHQTQGSFFLLFNAALNFDSLDIERASPPARRSEPANEETQH